MTTSAGWGTFARVCRMYMTLGVPQPGMSATRVSSQWDVLLRPAWSLAGGYPLVVWQMIGWHLSGSPHTQQLLYPNSTAGGQYALNRLSAAVARGRTEVTRDSEPAVGTAGGGSIEA